MIDDKILAYCEQNSTDESAVLQYINRQTHANVLMPRMLSGHLQGNTLALLAYLMQPTYILEVGTYTGYSAICLAQGLQPNGKLYTIDCNEELADFVRENIAKANLSSQIELLVGKGLEVIPTLPDVLFDLVFIDADKLNYSNYYDAVFDKVRIGGIIIADNVLWSGKVVTESTDKDTQAMKDYNTKIQNDSRVQNTLLPIRDGLMVARKIHN